MTTAHRELIERSLHAVSWQEREAATTELRQAGRATLPALTDALDHRDWRHRRFVAQMLDNVLDDQNVHVLLRALKDENAIVRRNALHSLSCEHCKPEGCWSVDITGELLEVVRSDRSPRVRVAAIAYLSGRPPESRIVETLRAVHQTSAHERVRFRALRVLEAMEQRLAAASCSPPGSPA